MKPSEDYHCSITCINKTLQSGQLFSVSQCACCCVALKFTFRHHLPGDAGAELHIPSNLVIWLVLSFYWLGNGLGCFLCSPIGGGEGWDLMISG